MGRWQGSARRVIGVFTLAFGVAVFVSIRERPAVEDDARVEGLDPDAVFESTGTVVTQITGATRDFVLEAERQVTYADDTTRLEDVTITVERDDGRDFVITGRQAEVDEDGTQVVIAGDVRVRVSDGLVITTQQATYNDRSGGIEAPAFVEFSRGRLHGSGVGAVYNRTRDLLRLLDQAHVTIGEGSGGRTDVTSNAAVLARDAHYMRFMGNVRIDQDDQTTTANRAIAYFDADGGAIEMVELRGEARMRGHAAAPGGMELMRARDFNLTYAEGTGLLRHAMLAGGAVVGLAGPTANDGQRIAGEWIDASLAPDGATVTALNAREHVEVELPAEGGQPVRHVTAESMEARGTDAHGLTSAEFVGDVEYLERRGTAETEDVVIRSDRLKTSLGGTLSAMVDAEFTGGVVFRDGDVEGSSSRAFSDIAAGTLELRSTEGSAERPRVVDARTSVEADEIDLAMNGSGMSARGQVRSVLSRSGSGDASDAGATGQSRMPGMFASGEPAYVTGTALVYDSTTGLTTYTGAARLWQGDTAVQGDQIELDERTSDLRAIGNARSTFIIEELDEETQRVKEVPTIATGDTMHYEDALRSATYTTQAHVNGPQGDLTGDRIELYFGAAQRELERVESFQQVKLLVTGRTATGMQLTYYTADGRYVMHGAPVQILEELSGECRETRGKTLTFFRSTDTISVDGNEEVRTQSKTTGTCPAPQFH